MTGDDKQDKSLNSYLDGEDGVSEKYQAQAGEIPSEKLDAAILAASRKAVNSGPKSIRKTLGAGWQVPVSIAAVIVLSVLMVFNLPDESLDTDFDPDFTNSRPAMSIEFQEAKSVESTAGAAEQNGNALLKSGAGEAMEESGAVSDSNEDTLMYRVLRREQTDAVPAEPPPSDLLTAPPDLQPPAAPLADDRAGAPSDLTMESAIPQAGMEMRSADESVANSTEPERQAQEDFSIIANRGAPRTECVTPRPEVCTREYRPVCATRDTGIRCVTTPCDSTAQVEYANACSACADPAVYSYTDGQCEVQE